VRTTVLGILLAASVTQAQTKIQALATEIEADAKLENPRLGIDTLLRAAERIRTIDPSAARHLLDTAFPMLDRLAPGSPDTFRLMDSYSLIDPDAAERLSDRVREKIWAYSALVGNASKTKDWPRADRLIRRAAKQGYYAYAATWSAMRPMSLAAPLLAAGLLKALIDDFPASAKPDDAHNLLCSLAVFPNPDPDLVRAALTKVFAVVDRPGAVDPKAEIDFVSKLRLHGKEVQPANSAENALLFASAYQAIYDPEAFGMRLASLPSWGFELASVTRDEVRSLASAPRVGVMNPSLPKKYNPPPPRAEVLYKIAYQQDLPPQERRIAIEELIPLLSEMDVEQRFYNARGLFWTASNLKLEGLVAEIGPAYLAAIESAVNLNDITMMNVDARGEFHRALLDIDKAFADRDLPQRHPSIVSRRALARLDAAAGQLADFSATTADGAPFHLREMKGKFVVLDFWATWCEPCRAALPELEKVHSAWKDKIVVVGVDDELAPTIRQFYSTNAITYPTLLDPDNKIHNLFGIDGIPATFVFDPDGKYVGRVPFPHTEANILRVLKQAGLINPSTP
jgi:thiol-disulfide isomerase/thioredoxin